MPLASWHSILLFSVAIPISWATSLSSLQSDRCGTKESWVGTRVNHAVSVGADKNRKREFLMSVPPGDPTEPKPVLVAFHGSWDSALFMANDENLDDMARKKGFIAVYPEGSDDVPWNNEFDNETGTWRSWSVASQQNNTCNHASIKEHYDNFGTNNAPPYCFDSCAAKGLCARSSPEANPCYWTTCADDVDFVRAILDSISSKVCVDRSRIFAYGVSGGGMLLYNPRVSELFRAIVISKALPLASEPEAQLQLPPSVEGFLHISGSRDHTMPEEGGESIEGFLYKDRKSSLRGLCGGAISENRSVTAFDGISCVEIEGCKSAQALSCVYDGRHVDPVPGSNSFLNFFDRFKSSMTGRREANTAAEIRRGSSPSKQKRGDFLRTSYCNAGHC